MKKYIPKTKVELHDLVNDLDVNLGDIDVSNITDMSDLFYYTKRTNFDGIENWDVSNVTNMNHMFEQSTFDVDISNWDVSNVKHMGWMFYGSSFNQTISNWKLNKDCITWDMFLDTDYGYIEPSKTNDNFIYTPKTKDELKELVNNLDVDLGDIDVSNVRDMRNLFYRSKRIDFSGIESWDVSKVENMSYMFCNSNFNGDISNWDVSNVEDMFCMFANSQFNEDISKWNVSNVKNMGFMFCKSKFNQDISKWNVSNVENMGWMFDSSQFNSNISNWNVSNVEDMSRMFQKSPFNGDISKWELNEYISIDDETLKRIKN